MSVRLRPAPEFFEGHFPGHPILPAVTQLALVARALEAPLTALKGVRLRRTVEPDQELEVLLEPPGEEGWIRFELRRGRESVSTGILKAGLYAPADLSQPPEGISTPISDQLPHAFPARLVTGIAANTPDEITVVAEIPPGHPLVEADGRAPALLGIEAAAQAAAAREALARSGAGGPRIGYLVGIREARLYGSIPAGRPFLATARLAGEAPPLSIYEIEVPGIATGTISTYAVP